CRALARGVTAQEADHLAGIDHHVDVVEYLDGPVVGVHGLQLEQRLALRGAGHGRRAVGVGFTVSWGSQAHAPAPLSGALSRPLTASSTTSGEARLPR